MEDETPAHHSSRLESNITNSQVAAGRDINLTSYNVAGTFIQVINKYEGMAMENRREVSGTGTNYVDNEDEVAAGMMIPAPPSCILERDSQHDQIVAKLFSVPNARVAILGMGGIGKTSLACSIAGDPQIVMAYPRRLFVSFEGCPTPDLAYTNLATVFHIPVDRRSSHRQILSQILNYLTREKTLFIMDNFETFWEISNNRRAAEDFLAQLAALHELAIIVTLRGIQRPGNIRWLKLDPLQTLTQGASMDLLSAITQEEYSESDLVCIRKLLNGVAGIPLAVTLIGSLLRDESETPQSLWNHWTRESARAIRLVNEADSGDRLYRLDVSLRLSMFSPRMTDNARALLATISILPTGMNMDEEWLDRFQDLLPDRSVRDCIRTLRNVALATLDSSICPPRLKLLPPVRDFCLNHLSTDSELSRRLIDIYNTDLEEHQKLVSNRHYTWVTTELSNITALLNLAITLRYITDDLGRTIIIYTEWRSFLCMTETDIIERALDVLSEQPTAKSRCLQALGMTLLYSHRTKEAIQQLEQALFIQKEVRNEREMGWTLTLIGNAYARLGDCAASEHSLGMARDLYTEANDKWMIGSVLRNLADLYHRQSKLSEAERAGKEALELCRTSGNRPEEGYALMTLGRVYGEQGNYNLAFETLTSAMDVCKLCHDIHGEALINESIGLLYHRINKPNEAIQHFQSAVSMFERAQDFQEAANSRAWLQIVENSLKGRIQDK